MKNYSRLILVSLLLALVFTGCRPMPTPILQPAQLQNLPVRDFERGECSFAPPEGQEMVCGVVKVPQDYDAAILEEVDLQVIVFKSQHANPASDPLVFLGFNPEVSRFIMRNGIFASFMETRDAVFFSRQWGEEEEVENALDCSEIVDVQLEFLVQYKNRAGFGQEILDAYQICRDRLLEADTSLDSGSASQTAKDVIAIRQALGVKQINLFSANYSTPTALKLIEQYPDAIRSAILLSFYPPMAATDLEASFYFALQRLFLTCYEDEACNSAYPDLETKFESVIDRLETEPLILNVKHPENPEMLDVVIDGERFIYFLQNMLSSNNSIQRIPYLIQEIYDGSGYKLALDIQNSLMFQFYSQQGGMTSSECQERWSANSISSYGAQVYPAIHEALQADYLLFGQICSMWTQKEFNPPEIRPLATDLPVLVLQGAFDATFGPEQVEDWLKGFGEGQLVTLSGQGSGMRGFGSCTGGIITEFLDNPTKKVDSSCAESGSIEFVMPLQ